MKMGSNILSSPLAPVKTTSLRGSFGWGSSHYTRIMYNGWRGPGAFPGKDVVEIKTVD